MKITQYLLKAATIPFRIIKNFLIYISYIGTDRYCPVCKKSSRKFGKAGIAQRSDAHCIFCDSLERSRLVWLYFERMTDFFDGRQKNVLHIAPESCFAQKLKKRIGSGYLTADISNPEAMVKMDICNIQYPDEMFDVIYCSHVLEHVNDDKRAMHEFYRVLKSNGWAIILVPIMADKTFEDSSVTEPLERLKLFGQKDHVRIYGPDFVERLRESGFKTEVIRPQDFLKSEEIIRMGITNEAGEIYLCTK